MAIIDKIFNGKLNYDKSPRMVPKADYIDALNITRDSQSVGQDMVVANIVGNVLVNFALPTGFNKRIGSREDVERNRVYYFIWNSFDHDLILYYDAGTDTIIKLIENIADTGGIDVLKFNPSFKINHIDIIYRDEGDLVFWTDGNVSPRKFNETHIINHVYSSIKTQFIEVAKRPPLSPPLCVYGTDTTRNANSLKRAMFQATYRFTYDDFEKSTYATYSKVPLPIGFYGSDNNIDNTKNNFFTITFETGDENVTAIEIAIRNNILDAWGDFLTIVSLNKAQLGIPNNTTFNYLFYNDGSYDLTDAKEVALLFDWVPQKAFGQCLPNGNVVDYANITEGYDNYPINLLQVSITAANVTNTPPDTNPPALTYTQSGNTWTFTVSGTVPVGTHYQIFAFVPGSGPVLFSDYTSIGGDTINDVAQGLRNYIVANWPGYAGSVTANTFLVVPPVPGFSVIRISVTAGGSGGGTISTEKTWLWDANYIFGIVYVDEQNRDMPGVTTYVNPVDSINDFVVTTPSFSQSSGAAQTPVITASINHIPPAGAVKYYWVRKRQTYSDFLMYETCDFQDPGDGYLYFCLANIDQYKADNNQFNYSTAPVNPQSRIKIIVQITASAYTSNIYNQDYLIVGTVIRTLTSGSSPADDKLFIKVVKPTAPVSPAYTTHMLAMVYTPLANPTTLAETEFFEWGEAYDIYTPDGGLHFYHRGKNQDQTAIQPATFIWPEGDVYFHNRTMYNEIRVKPYVSDTVPIMDAGFSDFFLSSVNDNGRAQTVEINAKKTNFPVLDRFSLEYEQDTNINQTNRFYFDNSDTYDRSFGAIQKLFIEERYMYVFQQFDIGVVPVLTQVVRDTANDPLQANSDQLLNKITYPYKGRVGIGTLPESFAQDKFAKYGLDNNKGIIWRLSQDGIIILSVLYETNSFFIKQLAAYRKDLNNGNGPTGLPYSGDATVYGVFDAYTNKYVLALEEINRYDSGGNLIFHQDAKTINFLETRDTTEGFESPLSYQPEGMTVLSNLLITWKNGQLWRHNSDTYNNFYGVQYESYVDVVFNEFPSAKKSWQAIMEVASTIWDCPKIETSVISIAPLNLPQQSNLITQDFEQLEGQWNAALKRDLNSLKGLISGDSLKGEYIIVRFRLRATDAAKFNYLAISKMYYKDSALNTVN